MKNIFLINSIILIVAALMTMSRPVAAQWVSSGPDGGNVTAVGKSGSVLLAGTDRSSLFRSTDAGQTWTPANAGLTSAGVFSIATSGSTTLIGTNSGVFSSANNGASWTAEGLTGNRIESLLIVGGTWYAGAFGTGSVYRSTNNGTSWTDISGSLPASSVNALVADGSTVYAGLGSGAGSGVFRYNGSSWTGLNPTPQQFIPVSALIVSGSTIYKATDAGVIRSTNGGTSWAGVTFSLPAPGTGNDVFRDIVLAGSTLYAANLEYVFKSTDGGTTWAHTGLGAGAYDLFVDGTDLYAGTYQSGLFRSANGGAWTALNNGIHNHLISALLVNGTTTLASGQGGLFRSTDNGLSWAASNAGLTNPNLNFNDLATDGSAVYAAANNGVFKSTDDGVSWAATGALTQTNVSAVAVGGGTVYAGTFDDGMFRSANGGTSWTAANSSLSDPNVRALATRGANAWVGTEGGGVFRSSNGGGSWAASNSGLTNRNVRALLAGPGSTLYAGTDGGVFVSVNDGASWTAGGYTAFTNALALAGGKLYAGSGSGGVYVSSDNGTTWATMNTGLTNDDIRALAVSGPHLLAGTNGSSVFRYALPSGPLAVTLAEFSGQAQGAANLLSWATASETNNAYFEVQRRFGTGNFEPLAQVAGAGTAQRHIRYHYLDAAPPAPVTYYRLKQVDFDGTCSFSPVAAVASATRPSSVAVWPTPSAGPVHVRSATPFTCATLTVYRTSGSAVLQQKGLSGQEFQVDLSGQTPGVYALVLRDDQHTLQVKLVLTAL